MSQDMLKWAEDRKKGRVVSQWAREVPLHIVMQDVVNCECSAWAVFGQHLDVQGGIIMVPFMVCNLYTIQVSVLRRHTIAHSKNTYCV